MGEIGVGIVLLILSCGLSFLIMDIEKRIRKTSKYNICFKDSIKNCGVPIIKLKINNKYESFLIDSGASGNYISEKYYNKLKIKPQIIGTVNVSNTTSTAAFNTVKISLSINKMLFENEEFSIMPLDIFESETFSEYKIIGIISSPFFEKYKWTIDYDDLVIWTKK